MGATQEHQKFLESIIVELLKEGDIYRVRLNPTSIFILLKVLRGNHN